MRGLRGHQQSGTRRLNGHYQSGGKLPPWTVTKTDFIYLETTPSQQYIGVTANGNFDLKRRKMRINLSCDFTFTGVAVTPQTVYLSPECILYNSVSGDQYINKSVDDNANSGLWDITQSGVYSFHKTGNYADAILIQSAATRSATELNIILSSNDPREYNQIQFAILLTGVEAGGILEERDYTFTIQYK